MTTNETIKKERDMKPMLPKSVLTTGLFAFGKANMLLRGSRVSRYATFAGKSLFPAHRYAFALGAWRWAITRQAPAPEVAPPPHRRWPPTNCLTQSLGGELIRDGYAIACECLRDHSARLPGGAS